MNISSRHKI